MILLFGDSWARHACCHRDNKDGQWLTTSSFGVNIDNQAVTGYQHWDLPDVFVEFLTNNWFNSYFKQHQIINFAEFGNTNDWILRDMYERLPRVSNFSKQIDVIVYQSDPMRIFAPRADYTDRSIVWPNFIAWAEKNSFDYQQKSLEDLIHAIFTTFYERLEGIKFHAAEHFDIDIKLHLVGGVNAIYRPGLKHRDINICIPSVTEHFGYKNDTVFENHLALHRLIGFWTESVGSAHRHTLLKEWDYYDQETTRKAAFWTNTPEYFAGRHLTITGMQHLATYIENYLSTLAA
jgi:hypothetical protein